MALSFNWSPAIIHLVLLNIPPGGLLISPFHVQHYLTLCPTPKNISSRMLLCCLLIIEYLPLKHFHSVTWEMQLYLSHWPWKGTINVNNVAPTAKITTSWRKRKNLKTSSQLNFTGKKIISHRQYYIKYSWSGLALWWVYQWRGGDSETIRKSVITETKWWLRTWVHVPRL